MTKSRDQDLFYYFVGLSMNPHTRHFLVKKFRQDYDAVRHKVLLVQKYFLTCPPLQLYKRLADNFGINYLIRVRLLLHIFGAR